MKKMSRLLLAAGLLVMMCMLLPGCGKKETDMNENLTAVPTAAEDGETLGNTAPEAGILTGLSDYSLAEVDVTDDYCNNAFDLEVSYLLSFDTDKLLAGFRETAGLDMNNSTRYGGWETSLIGGHTMGHYLTACAQAYESADSDSESKAALYEKITTIIDELSICQQNSKGETGFIFGATVLDINNVELQFDNVEHRKTNITTEAWVPWYTMHKLIAGITDVYKLTGYEPALTVASLLGDWVYNRTSQWTDAVKGVVLAVEYGGMNDCMYELYSITGDEKHAAAAHSFDQDALFERVLAGGENVLNNLHANTTIPKFLGALNRYKTLDGVTINGEQIDASKYLEYAKAFWQMVIDNHTYITGGNSEWEHFGEDGILDAERTNCNCETCNSYNMLKLSRELFKITGDSKYIDYYETAYYNSILSSQNPETGMTTYFQAMSTGYFKVYGEQFNKFWCCTGSGMENFTKLGDTIYSYSGRSIFVNLYVSSVLEAEEQAVTLTQTSAIPLSDTVEFKVAVKNGTEADVELRFRIPDWAAGDMVITVNGVNTAYAVAGGYAVIAGPRKNNDVIQVQIPEEVKAYSLPDNDDVYAFKYGPVVLSAELGSTDMTTTTTGVNVTIPKLKLVEDGEEIVLTEDGLSVAEFMKNINDYLVRDANELKFKLTGTDRELIFTCHYLQYTQRYGIYWSFVSKDDKETAQEADKRSEDTVLDIVQPGYGQYENDELHMMQESNSQGMTDDGTYRYALPGGWFSYRMKVDSEAATCLVVTLRAEEVKPLVIRAGSTVIYEGIPEADGKNEEITLRIAVPEEIIRNESVNVTANGESCVVLTFTFSGNDSSESAKVSGFINTISVQPLYETDSSVAYFVDCGDHDTTTVSEGDKFGIYNSVTEQLYGFDAVTGYEWGLVDDSTDQYGGSGLSAALYTANTWAYEYNKQDGLDKLDSNRYTKNQLETGITPRYLDYAFSLPDGTYTLEIGFANPWNCSGSPSVYLDMGTDHEILWAEKVNVLDDYVVGTCEVTGGKLTINVRSVNSCINISYIKISFNAR